MALHHNISGEQTTALMLVGGNDKVSTVTIANVHDDTACSVDLYIEKIATGRFYYFKGLVIPPFVSFKQDVSFNNSVSGFGFFVKLTKTASETPAVDIIIR